MRIENVVALTRGELITAPSISHFEDTMVSTSLVKRGDLFIALNPEEIVKAIYAGAYGIIYDDDTITPMDPEIAFIKVRNTKAYMAGLEAGHTVRWGTPVSGGGNASRMLGQ